MVSRDVTLYFLFVFIREAKENILHQSRTMNITPWQCGTGHERKKSPRPGYDLYLSTDPCMLPVKNRGIWLGKYICIHIIYNNGWILHHETCIYVPIMLRGMLMDYKGVCLTVLFVSRVTWIKFWRWASRRLIAVSSSRAVNSIKWRSGSWKITNSSSQGEEWV